MDLPGTFFPSIYKHQNSHHPRRDYFRDYGSHMNIDVNTGLTVTEGKAHCVTQRCHPDSWNNHHLTAVQPVLPLSDQPVNVPYPYQDRIGDVVNFNREKACFFMKRMRYSQGRLCLKVNCQFHLNMKDIGDQVKNLGPDNRFESSIFPRVAAMCRDYQHFFTNSKYIRVNSKYTGGCVCSLQVSDTTYLSHPSGKDFSKLNIVQVCGGEKIQSEKVLFSIAMDVPALEMRSSYVHNTGYCCVRSEMGYRLYCIAQNGNMVEPFCVNKKQLSEDKPTSLCLSPYIPGEVLVSTNTGGIHLYPLEHSVEILCSQQPLRFPSSDPWRQVSWAAHPRQVILADRTCVQLFDSRTKYGEGMDLFAQPSKLLHQEERVTVTHTHPDVPYYHFIATDFSLMLIDQRLPLYPVMMWSHTLCSAPQYLVPITQDTSNTLILLASQTPPDIHCFHIRSAGNQPAQSVYQPLKLSTVSEMMRYKLNMEFEDEMVLQQRLNSSLAGLTGCYTRNNLHSYQLNSHGEVFYQICGIENEEKEGRKTVSEARQVVGRWMAHLQIQFDQMSTCDRLNQVLDVSDKLQVMTDEPSLPHVLCPLCMPVTSSLASVQDHHQEDNTACRSCGHSLHLANIISQHTDKKCVMTSYSVQAELFDIHVPSLQQMSQCSANTKLLLGLWSGNGHIEEFVKCRERERESLQKKKHKMRAEHKSHRRKKQNEERVVEEILSEFGPRTLNDMEWEEEWEEEELETGIDRVHISPQYNQFQRQVSGGVDITDKYASCVNQPQSVNTELNFDRKMSSSQNQKHNILTSHLRFSSVTPELCTPLAPPSDSDDDMYFSQEVQQSLEMSLPLPIQSFQEDISFHILPRTRKQSEHSKPLKKMKTVPGF